MPALPGERVCKNSSITAVKSPASNGQPKETLSSFIHAPKLRQSNAPRAEYSTKWAALRTKNSVSSSFNPNEEKKPLSSDTTAPLKEPELSASCKDAEKISAKSNASAAAYVPFFTISITPFFNIIITFFMSLNKSNELTRKSRFILSLQEQKIVLFLISKIKLEDIDSLILGGMREINELSGLGVDYAVEKEGNKKYLWLPGLIPLIAIKF